MQGAPFVRSDRRSEARLDWRSLEPHPQLTLVLAPGNWFWLLLSSGSAKGMVFPWSEAAAALENGQINKDTPLKVSPVQRAFLQCLGFPSGRGIKLLLHFSAGFYPG